MEDASAGDGVALVSPPVGMSGTESPAVGPLASASASQSSVEASQSIAADSPKPPMLSSKSGFVIPKNRLSGALVPVTRGTKWEPEENKDPTVPLRKTKWGPDLAQDPVVKRGRALALQTRAEQIAAQLEAGILEPENSEASRSPSPPPIYDVLGHRMNTREGRKREQLDVERRDAIAECMKLNPLFKPPAGFRTVFKEAKLFIPTREHPGYNFIGQILGPRGLTQKRMEAETGTKITIRGKGAVKEGKLHLIRPGSRDVDGCCEDLHVHIQADTYEKVDAAVVLIRPLLIPLDEERNIHKMKQLRELAEMNGTVRDFTIVCTFCGEIGHKEWHCPRDKLQTFQSKVICRLCGDGSHPTADCPLKFSGEGKTIDKEYLSFLQELGGDLGGIDSPSKDQEKRPPRGAEQKPMLLTASGAQPMPERWPATADGSIDLGGFPPFPFPIPPPGTPARASFDFFLQRFFNPSMLNLFRGRPPPFALPPTSLQMMARLFPAFMGRLPMPSRPEMRPPSNSVAHESQPSSVSDAQLPNFQPAGVSYDTSGLLNTTTGQSDISFVSSAMQSTVVLTPNLQYKENLVPLPAGPPPDSPPAPPDDLKPAAVSSGIGLVPPLPLPAVTPAKHFPILPLPSVRPIVASSHSFTPIHQDHMVGMQPWNFTGGMWTQGQPVQPPPQQSDSSVPFASQQFSSYSSEPVERLSSRTIPSFPGSPSVSILPSSFSSLRQQFQPPPLLSSVTQPPAFHAHNHSNPVFPSSVGSHASPVVSFVPSMPNSIPQLSQPYAFQQEAHGNFRSPYRSQGLVSDVRPWQVPDVSMPFGSSRSNDTGNYPAYGNTGCLASSASFSSSGIEKGYSYESSLSEFHSQPDSARTANQWDTPNRFAAQQRWVQPQRGVLDAAGKWGNYLSAFGGGGAPQADSQESDPEYDKLMASVGVL